MSDTPNKNSTDVVANFPWGFGSSILRFVAAYLIAFVGMLILQVAGMVLISPLFQGGIDLSNPAQQIALSTVLSLSFFGGYGAAALFLARGFRKRGLSMLKEMAVNLDSLDGSLWRVFKQGFYGFVAIGAINIAYSLLVQVLGLAEPVSPAGDMAVQFSGLAYLIFALSGVIGAPILEELIFRGFLMNACRIGFRQGFWAKLLRTGSAADWAAIIVSSAVFGAVHMTPTGFPVLFASGVVFAVLYRRSGSLVPAMIAHFLLNSMAFVALLLQ